LSQGISTIFKREIHVWQYDKIDIGKFNKNIDDIDWNDKIGHFDDVDDMCNEFSKTFLEIDRDCIPTKEIIVRENDKLWFNNTLRKELRIRDRIRKKALKHNIESDITKLKKQRNKVINMKKND
jgi:regulator of replication initiation timing